MKEIAGWTDELMDMVAKDYEAGMFDVFDELPEYDWYWVQRWDEKHNWWSSIRIGLFTESHSYSIAETAFYEILTSHDKGRYRLVFGVFLGDVYEVLEEGEVK